MTLTSWLKVACEASSEKCLRGEQSGEGYYVTHRRERAAWVTLSSSTSGRTATSCLHPRGFRSMPKVVILVEATLVCLWACESWAF